MLERQNDLIGYKSQPKAVCPMVFKRKSMINNIIFIFLNIRLLFKRYYLKNEFLLIKGHILPLKEGHSAEF